jgi:hypothetical protein
MKDIQTPADFVINRIKQAKARNATFKAAKTKTVKATEKGVILNSMPAIRLSVTDDAEMPFVLRFSTGFADQFSDENPFVGGMLADMCKRAIQALNAHNLFKAEGIDHCHELDGIG